MREMRLARVVQREPSGDERLAAIDLAGADIAVAPSIDVDLERCEVEEGVEGVGHSGMSLATGRGDRRNVPLGDRAAQIRELRAQTRRRPGVLATRLDAWLGRSLERSYQIPRTSTLRWMLPPCSITARANARSRVLAPKIGVMKMNRSRPAMALSRAMMTLKMSR